MDTFCTEQLTLLDTFQVTFTPGFQKTKRRQIYISFLNVPSEAEESALTQCVEAYATVSGRQRYLVKKHSLIEYLTATRV